MTRLSAGEDAIWTTNGGNLIVPVRIVAFSGPGNRDAQIVVLRDAFDEVSGFRAGERIYPVPRRELSGVGQ